MSRGVNIGFQKISRLALVTVVFFITAGSLVSSEDARPTCASSSYYPASSTALYDQVQAFFRAQERMPSGQPVAIIVPNESYIYVGSLLGIAYNVVSKHNFDKIVIFGYDPSANPVNLYSGPDLITSMGGNPIDNELCQALIRNTSLNIREVEPDKCLPASIELQLPFLQNSHSQVPVVPIGLNGVGLSLAQKLGRMVAELTADEQTLFIAASNLSSSFDIEACESSDNRLIQLLHTSRLSSVIDNLKKGEIDVQSSGALIATIAAAIESDGANCEILRYENTGRLTGNYQHVCGYISAVITAEGEAPEAVDELTPEIGEKLLKLARGTIEISTGKLAPMVKRSEIPEDIVYDGVHLDIISNERESGVGMIRPKTPLYDAVRDIAIAAAFNDPRYKSIVNEDTQDIRLRLYIIYNLQRLTDLEDFVPGTHGIWISRGGSSAKVFPNEMDLKLSKEDILGRVSLQAGLFSDSWKRADTELWTFEIQVFEEVK